MAEENFSHKFDERIRVIGGLADAVYRRVNEVKGQINRQSSATLDDAQGEWLAVEFEVIERRLSELAREYKASLPR